MLHPLGHITGPSAILGFPEGKGFVIFLGMPMHEQPGNPGKVVDDDEPHNPPRCGLLFLFRVMSDIRLSPCPAVCDRAWIPRLA